MSKLRFSVLFLLMLGNLCIGQLPQAPKLRPFQQEGKWGYIDSTGKIVIKPQFYWAEEFSEGLAAFENDEGLHGYIDETGKVVIEPILERWSPFSEGLAAAAIKNMEWGYIDKSGKWVIKPQFAYANSFRDGLAPVKLRPAEGEDWVIGREKTAIIDRTGQLAFKPVEYVLNARVSKEIGFFQHVSQSPAGGDSPSLLIDRRGNVIFEGEDIELDGFSEGLTPAKKGGKWGYVDAKGKFVIQPRFIYAKSFSEGLAAVNIGERKWGYIDRFGKFVIPAKFEINELGSSAHMFSEGLALVYVGDDMRFIDKKGNTILTPKVTEIEGFSGGLASFKNKYDNGVEERGYLDKKGRFVWGPTPFRYKANSDVRAQLKKREEREGSGETLIPLTDDEKRLDYRAIVANQPDFSAEISYFRSHYVSGSGFSYKLTRKGNRFRKESQFWTFVGETGKSRVRLNPDKTYDDREGVDNEALGTGSDFNPKLLVLEPQSTFTPLGKVTINGHECIKIAVKRKDAAVREEELYLYAAKELKNLIIVAQWRDSNSTLVQRLQNITLDVRDALVQVPPDYTKAIIVDRVRLSGQIRQNGPPFLVEEIVDGNSSVADATRALSDLSVG